MPRATARLSSRSSTSKACSGTTVLPVALLELDGRSLPTCCNTSLLGVEVNSLKYRPHTLRRLVRSVEKSVLSPDMESDSAVCFVITSTMPISMLRRFSNNDSIHLGIPGVCLLRDCRPRAPNETGN